MEFPQQRREQRQIFREERGQRRMEFPQQRQRQERPEIFRDNRGDRQNDQGERWAQRRGERPEIFHGDREGRRGERTFRPQDNNNYMGYDNYGQFRSAQVHERNYQRKLDRDFWRTRNSIVGFGDYWRDDDYDNDRWRSRDWWRNRIVRYDTYNSYYPYSYYPYSGYQSYPIYNYYQPVVATYYTFGYPTSYYDAYYPAGSYYDPYYGSYIYNGYDPYYSSYGYDPYYSSYGYDPYYGYNNYYGGGDWKTALIRTVVSLFLGGGNGTYYDDPYYAYDPYNYASYYPSYVTQPRYYYSAYPYSYSSYVPQYGVYSAPQYGNYYSYVPSYNSYPYSSYDPYAYANYGDPFGGLFGIGGGDLDGTLVRRAIGTAYYQGYLEGQAARRQGWGDEYYCDPYQYYSFDGDYVDTYYDPYSSSLGDSRRIYSEGYEQGYRDALAGNSDLYDDYDGSNVDLVSLLLGSTLSMRS